MFAGPREARFIGRGGSSAPSPESPSRFSRAGRHRNDRRRSTSAPSRGRRCRSQIDRGHLRVRVLQSDASLTEFCNIRVASALREQLQPEAALTIHSFLPWMFKFCFQSASVPRYLNYDFPSELPSGCSNLSLRSLCTLGREGEHVADPYFEYPSLKQVEELLCVVIGLLSGGDVVRHAVSSP